MKHFTDLEAWKIGVELLIEIRLLTNRLPQSEQFGMTTQLRRSSQSILANMAEGFGRFTFADKANKFTISKGEAVETEAFLLMSVALKFFTEMEIEKALALTYRVQRLLSGLISSCRNRS